MQYILFLKYIKNLNTVYSYVYIRIAAFYKFKAAYS